MNVNFVTVEEAIKNTMGCTRDVIVSQIVEDTRFSTRCYLEELASEILSRSKRGRTDVKKFFLSTFMKAYDQEYQDVFNEQALPKIMRVLRDDIAGLGYDCEIIEEKHGEFMGLRVSWAHKVPTQGVKDIQMDPRKIIEENIPNL
jgi:hypothetical protein